jgi:hypothetical protein
MKVDPPKEPGASAHAPWLAARIEDMRIAPPDPCRPGVEANAKLLQTHWDTLRRAAVFAGDDRER